MTALPSAVQALAEEVCAAARRLVPDGLAVATAGNISARDPGSGLVAVTPSGQAYGSLTPADVAVVDPDGRIVRMRRWARFASSRGSAKDRIVTTQFSIQVAKENLKFSAAHFIAYPGFREPLHGHNYQVGVRVEGRLTSTGYVIDFGLIKKLTKEIVDRLDERRYGAARVVFLRWNI